MPIDHVSEYIVKRRIAHASRHSLVAVDRCDQEPMVCAHHLTARAQRPLSQIRAQTQTASNRPDAAICHASICFPWVIRRLLSSPSANHSSDIFRGHAQCMQDHELT